MFSCIVFFNVAVWEWYLSKHLFCVYMDTVSIFWTDIPCSLQLWGANILFNFANNAFSYSLGGGLLRTWLCNFFLHVFLTQMFLPPFYGLLNVYGFTKFFSCSCKFLCNLHHQNLLIVQTFSNLNKINTPLIFYFKIKKQEVLY